MKIDLGAGVFTSAGHHFGEVDRVILDPNTGTLSALVVKKGILLTRDVVVPLSLVASSDRGGIRLRIRDEDIDDLEEFVDRDFVEALVSEGSPYPGGRALLPLMPSFGAGYAPTSFQPGVPLEPPEEPPLGGMVSEGELAISEGTEVFATDGAVGRVHKVVLVPDSNRIAGLVVKRGTIFTHDIRVPMEYVAEASSERVDLSLSRADLERLPVPLKDDYMTSDSKPRDARRRNAG